MIHIRFSGVESDRYFIEADEEYLGRQWDNISEALCVEIPKNQQDSTCTLVFSYGKKNVDAITVMDGEPISIRNNVTKYPYIDVSFRFTKLDGYLKNTEVKRFYLAEALKPVDFVPEEPEVIRVIDELLARGYAESEFSQGKLKFKNVYNQVVKTLAIGDIDVNKVIKRLERLPTPTSDSPDLVMVNDRLYVLTGDEPTPPEPTEETLYSALKTEIPVEIDNTFDESDIPEDFSTTGFILYFTPNRQYECVAYPSKYGELRKIYQNDIEMFNLISQWSKTTVMKDDVEYYLYHSNLPLLAQIASKYQFLFN